MDAQQQVIQDLVQSSMEEGMAITAYEPRRDFANSHGMGQVGKVYEHVIGEEREHLKEFTEAAAGPLPSMCREPSMLREPSPHCVAVLGHPPECNDFFGTRTYVMCSAWKKMREQGGKKLPISEAWREARGTCVKP